MFKCFNLKNYLKKLYNIIIRMKKNIYIVNLTIEDKHYELMEIDRQELAIKLNDIIPSKYLKSQIKRDDMNGLICGSCKKIKSDITFKINRYRYEDYIRQNINIGCVNQSVINTNTPIMCV